jgi:hypothetical protein
LFTHESEWLLPVDVPSANLNESRREDEQSRERLSTPRRTARVAKTARFAPQTQCLVSITEWRPGLLGKGPEELDRVQRQNSVTAPIAACLGQSNEAEFR